MLVRYNPEGDAALNARQAARLKRLSDYLHGKSRSLFMFELLVPAEKAQLDRVNGDKKAYDRELASPADGRRRSSSSRMRGVEPDVWKIEGLDRREDCEKVVAAARRGGRDNVGCIILGRGEDDKKVREWLRRRRPSPASSASRWAARSFWDPLVALARESNHARGSGRRHRPALFAGSSTSSRRRP